MYKKAKNIAVDDVIIINDRNEHLIVQEIVQQEYTVHVYGFINMGTDREERSYYYGDSVRVVDEKPNKIKKIMEFIKCRIF